jgi:hypothetical protein
MSRGSLNTLIVLDADDHDETTSQGASPASASTKAAVCTRSRERHAPHAFGFNDALKQLTRPSCEITQRATAYGIGHYVV